MLLSCLSLSAQTIRKSYIKTRYGHSYIKATIENSKGVSRLSIELCDNTTEKEDSCFRTIGNQEYYFLKKIKKLKEQEGREVFILGVIGVPIGIFGGVAVGLFIETSIAIATGAAAGAYIPFLGITVGGASGVISPLWIDRINPAEQYRQYEAIRMLLTNEETILEREDDLFDVIDRIELVLSKID